MKFSTLLFNCFVIQQGTEVQYPVIQLFRFYNEDKVEPMSSCIEPLSVLCQGMVTENKFGQIFEVVTPTESRLCDGQDFNLFQ